MSCGPAGQVYFFNIVVVLLKFTLLDKRLLWPIGAPAAEPTLPMIPVRRSFLCRSILMQVRKSVTAFVVDLMIYTG
jgi:hypothetical protein